MSSRKLLGDEKDPCEDRKQLAGTRGSSREIEILPAGTENTSRELAGATGENLPRESA